MPTLLKDIIFWKYERASWQWDVLCLLILAFIFLTPKTWFDKREKLATQTALTVVKADDFSIAKVIQEKRIEESSRSEIVRISQPHHKITPIESAVAAAKKHLRN